MSLYSRLAGLVTGSINFAKGVAAPLLGQDAQTTDATTNTLTIRSQAPWASAVTNVKAGSIVFEVPPPVSGNPNGYVTVKVNGTTSGFNFGGATNSISNYTQYMGVVPGASNFALQSDGSNYLIVNAPLSTAKLVMTLGQGALSGMVLWPTGLQMFHSVNTSDHGGGTGVIGMTNASANPTTNATGGGILYATGGALTWRGSGGTVTTMGPT